MIKTLEKAGRTEDDAINAALKELGLDRDDVSVEIVERAKSGFFGIGATQAVVRVTYECEDISEPVKEASPAPAKAPAAEKEPESVKAPAPEKKAAAVKEQIDISTRENGSIDVELSGNGMGAIIGRRGETLDAIQHLTNYVCNHGGEKRSHINIDAESYRSKREDSLTHLAEKMAEKAIKYKRSMALEPMNSYERHVIHTALQDYKGVTTASTGEEPNRRVVVSYVKPEGGEDASAGKPKIREWA